MDNPETPATPGTQDTGRKQTKHNIRHQTKKIRNKDPSKTGGEPIKLRSFILNIDILLLFFIHLY